MFLLVIWLPMVLFCLIFFLGSFINSYILVYTYLSVYFVVVCLSVLIMLEIFVYEGDCRVDLQMWIDIDYIAIRWSFLFDRFTVVLLFMVLLISFIVNLFSVIYMISDPFFLSFMSYLILFVVFMILLISAGSFFQLFFGWEGVGLSSYFLVNFWFTRFQASNSAVNAVLINRVGDFCLYCAMLIILSIYGSLDFYTVFSCIETFSLLNVSLWGSLYGVNDVVCLFLLGAVMGKSAQVGLHTWLPDAMEGPTPVSALIHAATMVTAGIFVLISCSVIFETSTLALLVVTFVGAVTVVISSLVGMFQYDFNNVIAYSTCGQLGYMVFACGCSCYTQAFSHLFCHAYFNALLFLGAGSVIHAMYDEQDTSKYGNLLNVLPLSYIAIFEGSLSLMGMPFFSGFYSNDIVLEGALVAGLWSREFSVWLGFLSLLGTLSYSISLLYIIFNVNCTNIIVNIFNINESDSYILLALIVLCCGSIIVGYLFDDILQVSVYCDMNSEYIETLSQDDETHAGEFFLAILPVFLTVVGLGCAWCFSNTIDTWNGMGWEVFSFTSKWFFDIVYNNILIVAIWNLALWVTFNILDSGTLELLGAFGVSFSFRSWVVNLFEMLCLNIGRFLQISLWIVLIWYAFNICGDVYFDKLSFFFCLSLFLYERVCGDNV